MAPCGHVLICVKGELLYCDFAHLVEYQTLCGINSVQSLAFAFSPDEFHTGLRAEFRPNCRLFYNTEIEDSVAPNGGMRGE
jgi:hypothetical protein